MSEYADLLSCYRSGQIPEAAARARYEATRAWDAESPTWDRLTDSERASHIRLMAIALSAAVPADVAGLVAELTNEAYRHELQHIRSSSEIDRLFQQSATALVSMSAALAEARKALEPFAALAGSVFRVDEDGREMNESKRDDQAVWGHDRVEITYGHLRAARRAHQGGEDNG